VKSLDLTLSSQ
jgi:hypothetical protein